MIFGAPFSGKTTLSKNL
jgi:tRNA uridine 5-carbamoylmethylation protein Kti12